MATRVRPSSRSIKSFSSSVADKQPPKPLAKPPSLPKRLLFPHLPPHADLPPLLVSPAADPLLNAELYDFLALALRAFVNPWWTKISRYDKDFLPVVTRVITAVVRALETRLLATDLSPLVFRDLPTLLAQHVTDFRNAQSKLHTSYASGGTATLPQLFHQLQPHMAVSPDGRIDEVYVRTAVEHVLKTCLPPEDYDSDAERYIVREIILKVLLDSVLPRITQPWFIHKLMLDFMGPESDKVNFTEPPDTSDDLSTPTKPGFSFQALAIFFLSAIQAFSGVCLALIHAYRQARDTIKKVNESAASFPRTPRPSPLPSPPLDYPAVDVPTPVTPAFPGALSTPASGVLSPPAFSPSSSSTSLDPKVISRSSSAFSTPDPLPSAPPLPDYTHPPLALLLLLLTPPPAPPGAPTHSSTSTARAFAHALALPLTALAPFLARLLPYLLYMHVLSAARLADIVRTSRRTLFPDGWPGPSPVDPTPEEQAALREELGRRLLDRVSAPLAPLLGPTPAARAYTLDGVLAPLSSQACNAHLALFILDLVLLTVFPEMGVSIEGAGADADA
ncbi:PXA domain-containing protein [Amylocystis lapponica]|nr:PXA domain-containing protein [Amylocystis lapponica]